jgi:hypothetical protein
MTYSEDLKSFAVTLHFYSSQAYNFLRRTLHLPHPDTIRRWASCGVEPGFLKDVHSLQLQLANEPAMQDVCIIFDLMSIRKQVMFDAKEKKYAGYVNHGNFIMTSPETVATESLVFLVVGLKRFFKAPFAYFLVDKVSSAILSQIIKDSIILIAEAGFHVQALTCDGSYVNQAAMASIGCKFSVDGMNFEFPNPHTPAESISFFMDSCHMLKNVRNCFGDLSVLKHGNEVIEWRFIAELHKLQSSSTLNLANRLKGKHLDYGKNKMKVALAAQTLSSSVASAIDFLRSQGLEMFQGSEATCNFMRVFDEIFDLTNSSNIHAKGFKSPIKACNIDAKVSRIMLLTDYVKNLTDIHGKPLLHSRRKTGFVGFLEPCNLL